MSLALVTLRSGRKVKRPGMAADLGASTQHLSSFSQPPRPPTPDVRLPAVGSASVRTVKSMTREVKSKAVCCPLWTTEMQWRSP